jgi:hypothetical protein
MDLQLVNVPLKMLLDVPDKQVADLTLKCITPLVITIYRVFRSVQPSTSLKKKTEYQFGKRVQNTAYAM